MSATHVTMAQPDRLQAYARLEPPPGAGQCMTQHHSPPGTTPPLLNASICTSRSCPLASRPTSTVAQSSCFADLTLTLVSPEDYDPLILRPLPQRILSAILTG